jgi:poly(A) polymerase
MQSDIAAAAAVLEPSHPLEPYPVVSAAPSSEKEIRSSSSLVRYIDEVAPLVTLEEWGRREALLQEILVIFRRWVARVATEKGAYADEDSAMEAGGSMFVSGSYKLNVSDKNSDIDTICVAPSMVSRADFFDSLPKLLKQQPGVTALNAIATAKVPIIELEIYGVSVDLQFVSLPVSVVPRTLNILDDNVLLGLDAASVRTLNGPRVNQLIHRLVSNFDTFKGVVRVLRLWGKARGLYGNKNGYFGGVNFAILAAFICQLYPNRCVAGCVYQFFQTMKDWPWPRAIYINRPYTTPLNYEIWDPEHNRNHQSDVMPILTPAYPCMNSLDKACKSTLAVMMTEFVVSAAGLSEIHLRAVT